MANVKELAKELKVLVERHSKEGNARREISELKAALAYCASTVVGLEHEGKSWIKDCTRENLTAGAIEAEGFVRGCALIKNRISDWSEATASMVRTAEKEYGK